MEKLKAFFNKPATIGDCAAVAVLIVAWWVGID